MRSVHRTVSEHGALRLICSNHTRSETLQVWCQFPGLAWRLTGTEEKTIKQEDVTVAEITLQNLLGAGVHFGHQTRRWNPKMKKYIFTERNGIYIIDLQKTLALLNKACDTIREITTRGEPVLFVGTKPQASSIILEETERCGQYHVTNRWAGGMLTNYRTIRQSIKRLDHIEKMSTDGTYEHLTKKEVLNLEKQREKLSSVLSGIRNMNKLPGLLIIVDPKKEKIAVNEARRLGIPICAIIDTNCDPDPISFPVPGNDDAIRSIKILLGALTDAVLEGMHAFADKTGLEEKQDAVLESEKQEAEQQKRGRRSMRRDRIEKNKARPRTDKREHSKPHAGKDANRAPNTDRKKAIAPSGKESGKPEAKEPSKHATPKKTISEKSDVKTKDTKDTVSKKPSETKSGKSTDGKESKTAETTAGTDTDK